MSLLEKYQSTLTYIPTIDIKEYTKYNIKYIGYGCHEYENETDKFQINEWLNMTTYYTPKNEDGSYSQFIFADRNRPYHVTKIYEIDGNEKVINEENIVC
jgi:hypothetical protein